MTLTIQQTKEAILAMLGAANGLEAQSYRPHPSALKEYLAPGNYANAEIFERGAKGGKLNWVAYSAYGEKDYLNSQNLAAQLDLLFSDNELCQNVHITIYQNEDERGVSKVRRQMRATLARTWSAVWVQTKGFGSSLVTSRYRIIPRG